MAFPNSFYHDQLKKDNGENRGDGESIGEPWEGQGQGPVAGKGK